MLKINFSVGGHEDVHDVLLKLGDALETKVILDESAALLLNRIRTRYLSEQAPDGTKWVQSMAARRRAKASRGGGTLYDTGRLYQSIQLANRPPDGRIIGTDVFYAGFVNYGTVKLPPRIFMGISDGDIDLIDRLIIKRIQKVTHD